MLKRRAERVLLIGWDAADWRMIDPLLQAGQMPALKSLIDRGTSGNLASLRPMLSPMLWNTIATGHRADRHGVHGFTEPLPDGSGIRPVASTTRRCKALWNILTQKQMTSNIIGWYASHPAEPISGTMVSNRFEQPTGPLNAPWPIPPGTIHPESKIDELADLRVHPGEMADPRILLPFIPDGLEYDILNDPHGQALMGLIAQTTSIHSAATHLMANTSWDLTAIYYEGIDRAGHEFMEFHPPCQPDISEADVQRYQHCMTGMYRYHDMMLKTLLEIAGEETTVLLISDHGYYSDHRRPKVEEAGPVDWHRPFGIAVMAGPEIAPGRRLAGASLLDITPTVLDLLGLPAGSDMPGRAWAEAYSSHQTHNTSVADTSHTKSENRVISWEMTDGDDGRHPENTEEDPQAAQAALQQLIDLGYVDPPSEDTQETVEQTRICNQVNLATDLLDSRRYRDALKILEPISQDPKWGSSVTSILLQAYLALAEFEKANTLISQIECHENAHSIKQSQIAWMRSTIASAKGDYAQIIELLKPELFDEKSQVSVHLRRGQAHSGLKQLEEAQKAYQRVLDLEPDQAEAWAGLTGIALSTQDYESTITYGLKAVDLIWVLPRVHFYLGNAWAQLNEPEKAIEALRVCIAQAPGHIRAMRQLATILQSMGENSQALIYEQIAEELTKQRPKARQETIKNTNLTASEHHSR